MVTRAEQVGFFGACFKERVYQELERPPMQAHSTVQILKYMREHRVPISMPWGMDDIDPDKAVIYVAHALALKENPPSGKHWWSNQKWDT